MCKKKTGIGSRLCFALRIDSFTGKGYQTDTYKPISDMYAKQIH